MRNYKEDRRRRRYIGRYLQDVATADEEKFEGSGMGVRWECSPVAGRNVDQAVRCHERHGCKDTHTFVSHPASLGPMLVEISRIAGDLGLPIRVQNNLFLLCPFRQGTEELTVHDGHFLSSALGCSACEHGDRLAHQRSLLPQLAGGVQEGLELCSRRPKPGREVSLESETGDHITKERLDCNR